jgi:hypothetical protein
LLDILPLLILGYVAGTSINATKKFQFLHPTLRLSIVQMIIVPDHFGIGVAKPIHRYSFSHHAAVCTS